MQFWIIQGLNSLSLGGLLFLLSSGFSLIFGLMRLANLTHGAFFMLGTYFGATALRSFAGLNIWVTALAAGISGCPMDCVFVCFFFVGFVPPPTKPPLGGGCFFFLAFFLSFFPIPVCCCGAATRFR